MEQPTGSKQPLKKAAVLKAAPAAAQPVAAAAVPAQPVAAQVAQANTAAKESAAEEEPAEPVGPSALQQFLRESPSWMTSLIVHLVVLLVLGLVMLPAEIKAKFGELSINPSDVEKPEELEEILEEVEPLDIDVEAVSDITPQPVTDNIQEEVNFSPTQDLDSAAVAVELSDFGDTTAPKNDLLAEVGAVTGAGLEGRGAAARTALVRQGGGSPGSEEAVARALKWLAMHQMPDGGWTFDHRHAPSCQGKCPGHGTLDKGRNGATAMALLPFLGAGQTHREGNYKKQVGAGLFFLAKSMKVGPTGGSLADGGTMYSHGLAAIALCEAYGMTQDKGLMAPAQASLNYIVYAQDPVGGGWRYSPRQPGDTSAVGWQIMALKSGHMSYLQVPPLTIKKASAFLDRVQSDSGSAYGYTDPGNGVATSAVGLLSRMYLGWKKDNAALERGVKRFAASGPSAGNSYFNYYATQVMFQFTGGKGEMWKKWNDKMREQLISTQAKEGHAVGSWSIKGDHGSDRGGRIYCTSLSTLILEVYYRHMPIFKEAAVEEDFPL